jgi:hypothetical protein
MGLLKKIIFRGNEPGKGSGDLKFFSIIFSIPDRVAERSTIVMYCWLLTPGTGGWASGVASETILYSNDKNN